MTAESETTPDFTRRDLDPRRGARLDIDLGAVADNYRILRQNFSGSEVGVAVKADAYGLGIGQVAPVLEAAGARTFFVAHVSEALTLRVILPKVRIAVLNGLADAAFEDYFDQNLIPVLNQLSEIELWSAAAKKRGKPLEAYIHLDTGMSRLGLEPNEQARLSTNPEWLEGIKILAWMTHLSCADDPSHHMNAEQRDLLIKSTALLPKAPISLCNSAGIFLGREFHFDLARPGCALYGISPTPGRENPMNLAVRLVAPILQTRDILPGRPVGYGATYISDQPRRIATLPVGYADGFLRSMSNRGTTLIAGYEAPIVGRVSMDLITIDVTSVPENLAQKGEMVEVIGPHMTQDSMAELAGTIGYEVLTSLGHRYDRHYHGHPNSLKDE